MSFRPYLFFGGTCRDAFTRYHEIFGGDLVVITMADIPGETPPPDKAHYVIHAALQFTDDHYLMGSDDPFNDDFGPVQGMMCSYDAADPDDAQARFDALADGGTVNQALAPTFFSTAFGMCTDRFGTPWMVVAPLPGA
jgi:PhnB protein